MSLGPLYDSPDSNNGIWKTAHVDKIVCNAPKEYLLTAVVARRRQMPRDQAGILIEGVERLSQHRHDANNGLLSIQNGRLIQRNLPIKRNYLCNSER